MEVVGLHWLLAFTEGYYLTTPDAAVRRRTSEYFAELARLCRDLGGQILVLGSPKQRNLLPGVSHEQALQFAAEVIRGFVPALEECGVTLAVEPLGPQDGDFLLTADAAVELIQLVDSPCCRLHLDVKAMSTEQKPIVDIIRDNAPRLVHFHANDPNRRGPGMGDLDFQPILRMLQEVNYQGWVSVEVFDYAPGSKPWPATASRTCSSACRRSRDAACAIAKKSSTDTIPKLFPFRLPTGGAAVHEVRDDLPAPGRRRALLVGFSKTGMPGAGLSAVALMAEAFPDDAKLSVGAILPLLIVGDLFAISYYRRHADWQRLLQLFP